MSTTLSNNRFVLISVNPKAGRNSPMSRAERLKERLETQGFGVELHTNLDVVTTRANELFAANLLHVLVGVGGDGTAAELTNRTIPGLPITLLPSGTANLIAKYLHLPFLPDEAAETIARGVPISFDAGLANGRLFLVMVSVGIDAEVVRLVHASREESYANHSKNCGHISYLSYIKPILKTLFSYSYPNIQVKCELDSPEAKPKYITGKWGFVFNLPKYGWGLPLAPNSVGVDGKLDYCIFRRGKRFLTLLDVLFAQLGGLHRFLPNVSLGQSNCFIMSPTNENTRIPFQLDGDPGGFLPLKIEIIPNRFTALAAPEVVTQLEKFRQ